MRSDRTTTAAAVAAAFVVLSVVGAQTAAAAMSARAGQGVVATSGTWQAVATTAGQAPWPTGAFVVEVPNKTAANTALYLNVVNTGTVPLASATYALTAAGPAQAVLERCSAAWNESTGACPGTISTVVATSTGSASSTEVPAQPGAALRMRLRLTARTTARSMLTLDLTVPRNGARPPATTTG